MKTENLTQLTLSELTQLIEQIVEQKLNQSSTQTKLSFSPQKEVLAEIRKRRQLRRGDFEQFDSTELIREDRAR
jgi:hypothetical protein